MELLLDEPQVECRINRHARRLLLVGEYAKIAASRYQNAAQLQSLRSHTVCALFRVSMVAHCTGSWKLDKNGTYQATKAVY